MFIVSTYLYVAIDTMVGVNKNNDQLSLYKYNFNIFGKG
jgi:hypothetical protein